MANRVREQLSVSGFVCVDGLFLHVSRVAEQEKLMYHRVTLSGIYDYEHQVFVGPQRDAWLLNLVPDVCVFSPQALAPPPRMSQLPPQEEQIVWGTIL
jgi:hypothetical protein